MYNEALFSVVNRAVMLHVTMAMSSVTWMNWWSEEQTQELSNKNAMSSPGLCYWSKKMLLLAHANHLSLSLNILHAVF